MRITRIIAAIALITASGAFAQPAPAPATQTTATAAAAGSDVPSDQLRREFTRLLERYPPEVGKVLKLDPTLLANSGYLATYPELAAFAAEHPEVAHSPHFYLENVSGVSEPPAESAGMRMWRSVFEGISIFAVLCFFGFVLSWLVRTVIDHRRWSRLSRVQAEVHNKLLDRFTSNEELFAYIQTPAGKRFLESAPIQLDAALPRQVSAPVGRILWSVQAGLVLAAAGVGFQLVSRNIEKDVAQPLYAIGIIAIAVGLGFVVSSVVSYLVSRKLGLLDSAPPAQSE